MTRLFTACLGTETNTFAPLPTTVRTFEDTYLVRGGKHPTSLNLFAVPLTIWRERAEALGWNVVESVCGFAQPSGITTRATFESLRDEILRDLEAAMPVDAVLFSLHGAMVAAGYDDCEEDLVARVRARVGPKVPIGVELDLHCHVSRRFATDCNAVVIFKEYPHTDFAERAEELFTIVQAAVTGAAQPVVSVHDCRMIGLYHTTREPMASFVARMKSLEGKDSILSVSLAHGFPWADVPHLGSRTVVVTDGKPDKGAEVAAMLAHELWEFRDEIVPRYVTLEKAVSRVAKADKRPLVLADMSDNPGGGAAGDSTFIPWALIDAGIRDCAVACIWDPVAVGIARDAGLGTTLDLRIGGKVGPGSGDPLDLKVTVTAIQTDCTMDYMGGSKRPMGDAVAVRGEAIDFILHSIRCQTVSPTVFDKLGIDYRAKRALVVKSMQHFHAAFAPIAAEILYVAAPGTLAWDFRKLPYKRVARPVWPLDQDPFAGGKERSW